MGEILKFIGNGQILGDLRGALGMEVSLGRLNAYRVDGALVLLNMRSLLFVCG